VLNAFDTLELFLRFAGMSLWLTVVGASSATVPVWFSIWGTLSTVVFLDVWFWDLCLSSWELSHKTKCQITQAQSHCWLWQPVVINSDYFINCPNICPSLIDTSIFDWCFIELTDLMFTLFFGFSSINNLKLETSNTILYYNYNQI
jgi:hypothetical protein